MGIFILYQYLKLLLMLLIKPQQSCKTEVQFPVTQKHSDRETAQGGGLGGTGSAAAARAGSPQVEAVLCPAR